MVLSFKQFSADSLDWSHQTGGLEIPKPADQSRNQQEEERKRTPPLKCPRCDSANTKFCYYNNYSRLQPRHFCRACKRHWTHGGTLRHVPVGGGRKTKRAKTTHNDGGRMAIGAIHQQQQQVAAQISRELGSSIFPDILRQVLLHPPPPPPSSSDYSAAAGLLDSQMPPYQFMPGFSRTEPDASNPFSISTPPSSRPIDGSNTSTWLLDPPASPESFWGCWDEITADFAAPPDISRAAE